MRQGSTLYYLHGDHLGSASLSMDSIAHVWRMYYYAGILTHGT